jgi:hypothetical protein
MNMKKKKRLKTRRLEEKKKNSGRRGVPPDTVTVSITDVYASVAVTHMNVGRDDRGWQGIRAHRTAVACCHVIRISVCVLR